jgi:hypothetical protein
MARRRERGETRCWIFNMRTGSAPPSFRKAGAGRRLGLAVGISLPLSASRACGRLAAVVSSRSRVDDPNAVLVPSAPTDRGHHLAYGLAPISGSHTERLSDVPLCVGSRVLVEKGDCVSECRHSLVNRMPDIASIESPLPRRCGSCRSGSRLPPP